MARTAVSVQKELTVSLRTTCDLHDPAALGGLSSMGLVISEHIDKISFMEPSVTVREKEIGPRTVRFTLLLDSSCPKPVAEIVRGFRIGCFKIAREYHLLSPEDKSPVFEEGFTLVALAPPRG